MRRLRGLRRPGGPARWWRPGSAAAVVALVALALGLAATSSLWRHCGDRMLGPNLADAHHYLWWLGHTPHALARGDDPLLTTDLNWPEGVGAMNNTSLLLPAVLLWPVTALAGPLTTMNVLNLLAVPACTAGGYWALRRVPWAGPKVAEGEFPAPAAAGRGSRGVPGRPVDGGPDGGIDGGPDGGDGGERDGGDGRGIGLDRPAALVGAVTFGISPAVVNSLNNHITMAFAPLLPVLVVLGVRAAWSIRPVRDGVALGLVTLVQTFTGEEVLFQAVVAVGLVLLVVTGSRPRSTAAGAARAARTGAVALAVFLPPAAYPLYQQFLGPLRQEGSPFRTGYFGADLTAFTTPTDRVLLHTAAQAARAARFPGAAEEHLAYLGRPLLFVGLLTAVLGWRRLAVRCAAIGLLAAMVLSLGGRLWINGTWTTVALPYRILERLPVTESSLATRFGFLAALFAAALLAFAVQSLTEWRPRLTEWRPRLTGWRPRLTGWRPRLTGWRPRLTGRRPPLTGRRPRGRSVDPPGGRGAGGSGGRARLGPVLATVATVAALAPLAPAAAPVFDVAPVPGWFRHEARRLPVDSVVMVLPYPTGTDPTAMRWQAAAGYRFRMPGGYFLGPGPDRHAYVGGPADPPTANLLATVARSGQAAAVNALARHQAALDLNAWAADAVVLGPGPSTTALRRTVTDLLGREPELVDGVYLWADPVTG
jgi:hypothetical protein